MLLHNTYSTTIHIHNNITLSFPLAAIVGRAAKARSTEGIIIIMLLSPNKLLHCRQTSALSGKLPPLSDVLCIVTLWLRCERKSDISHSFYCSFNRDLRNLENVSCWFRHFIGFGTLCCWLDRIAVIVYYVLYTLRCSP